MANVEELATPVSGSLNTAPAAINLSTDALVYWSDSAGTWMQVATGGGGTAGTVTSITAGTGITLSPSPITTTGSVSLTVPVSIANGGTGATTAPAALANLGGISGNQTITLSGDSTGSGATAITTTTTGLQGRAIATTAPIANQVLQWSGTTWAPGTISGGATIADVAPVASPGALWWDSVGGQLYLSYDDGNSQQWVPAANQPGPQGPTGATGATGATGPQGPNWQVGPGLALNTGTTPNTIDVARPYAPLASPALTGNPTAPTPANNDADTSIATTAFVRTGTTTNDNAAAGQVGEYLSALKVIGSAVTLTPQSAWVSIMTLALTAGDWDVWAEVSILPPAGTGVLGGFLSVGAPAGVPADNQAEWTMATTWPNNAITQSIAPMRLSLAAGVTVTLYGYCNFAATATGFGKIAARRAR
jgi:hypothetical protein